MGLFNGCEWSKLTSPDEEINKYIRKLKEQDVDGFNAIFHLAAISNVPMGDLDEGLTESVNLYGSVHVAEIAKNAGVPRYLFAGSCSVYGKVNIYILMKTVVLTLFQPTLFQRLKQNKL